MFIHGYLIRAGEWRQFEGFALGNFDERPLYGAHQIRYIVLILNQTFFAAGKPEMICKRIISLGKRNDEIQGRVLLMDFLNKSKGIFSLNSMGKQDKIRFEFWNL